MAHCVGRSLIIVIKIKIIIIMIIIIKMIIIAIIVIIIINGKLTMDIPLGGSSFPLFSD